MVLDTNFFVTFPTSGPQTIAAGISRIDYLKGHATLTDGSLISLGNRSTHDNPFKSIYFHNDVGINIDIFYENKLIYKGFLPSNDFYGGRCINDILHDLIIITTTASTELIIVSSHNPTGVGK